MVLNNRKGQGGYQRPVSLADRLFLAQPRSIPPVTQTVVEGVGDLGLAELKAAVARAGETNPGTRLRLRGRTWVDSGPTPRVRVVEGSADGRRVADLAALHDPLPSDGALCEVLWCPGSPAVVVFRASHAVMDGRGRAMWVADVFRSLRGEEVLGAPSAVTESDVIERLGTADLEPSKLKNDCQSPLGEPSAPGARRTVWARRTVDGYLPALVAKVATALLPAYGLDQARFAVAFDLRRHLPEERTTGNLSQLEWFEVAAGESWEELHERVLAAMTAGKVAGGGSKGWGLLGLPLPVLWTLIRMVESAPAQKRRYNSVSALSHQGRMELPELCTPSFEARTTYSVPLLTAMAPPELDLQECGGRTELTLTWRDGPGMAERADAVLEQVAEALSPARRRNWPGNDTGRPLPDATVVQLLRARASQNPQAVALQWPGGSMTFAELDHRSEVVAARLSELGEGRGSVVGLLADRSADSVVGLWGVLKAGAAYLPLDPQHPDERLAGVLADAGAAVCLVRRSQAARDRALGGCERVVVDELPYHEPQSPVASDPGLGDLAYVIYTSGSTGKPKGVEVEHGALANYVGWATRRFDIDADTRFALFASLAFDLSNTALYPSLLAGGSLVLVPGEPNHLTLGDMLERSGANALKLTPSHLELVNQLDLRPAGFRLLVVGGEPLRSATAERARRQFGSYCRIFNHYGPTEATVGCVANLYRPEHSELTVVPIGTPADNSTVHLLDAQRQFVPVGETGEMYLGGVQLARGYRGRPDLTRERFVRLADGTRVYRSGDLARVLPTGELEFAGRADDQVKVMGYRVEPAEVVDAVEAHPRVREAVVVPRPGPDGNQVLCAYVVADPAVSVDELTEFLRDRLPRYLVPSAIRMLDGFTRTLNGKIDVQALPDPFQAGPAAAEEPAAADQPDAVHDAVAGIWARILEVDAGRLGAATDFHQVGGSSMLLLAMLATVSSEVVGPAGEREFMSKLGQIIRRPTLEQVSEFARLARSEAPGAGAEPAMAETLPGN